MDADLTRSARRGALSAGVLGRRRALSAKTLLALSARGAPGTTVGRVGDRHTATSDADMIVRAVFAACSASRRARRGDTLAIGTNMARKTRAASGSATTARRVLDDSTSAVDTDAALVAATLATGNKSRHALASDAAMVAVADGAAAGVGVLDRNTVARDAVGVERTVVASETTVGRGLDRLATASHTHGTTSASRTALGGSSNG